jgi:hypothetical protein
MVRRHMPNALATARGHLDKARASQPHAASQAVSTMKRHHRRQMKAVRSAKRRSHEEEGTKVEPEFDYSAVTKSATPHLDYAGPLPEPCTSGTRYFMVSCNDGYIHLEALTTLRAAQTVAALTRAVTFFRHRHVNLTCIRMDN